MYSWPSRYVTPLAVHVDTLDDAAVDEDIVDDFIERVEVEGPPPAKDDALLVFCAFDEDVLAPWLEKKVEDEETEGFWLLDEFDIMGWLDEVDGL